MNRTGRTRPTLETGDVESTDSVESVDSASARWRVPAIEVAIVVAASVVVLLGLSPTAIFSSVVPTGTDLTGHYVGLWIDRTNPSSLVPGGWSSASFGGYPANQLYPPLGTAVAALLSLVLPAAVALKLLVVLPQVLLVPAAWFSARWAGLPRGLAVLWAVAMVPLGFDTSCAICGGNIASTVNGEFAFTVGLALALLSLGAIDRFLRQGDHGVRAALLVAAAALSHPVTALWLAVGAVLLLVIRGRMWWPRRRAVGLAVAGALLMSAWWWLPFIARRDWMTRLGFPKRTDIAFWLFPASPAWQVALGAAAVLGMVVSLRRGWTLSVVIGLTGVISGLAFVAIPDGWQLFNLRVLPFWYLAMWLLAAAGVYWLAVERLRLGRLSSASTQADVDRKSSALATTALIVSVLVIGTTWGWWAVDTPSTPQAEGTSRILGASVTIQSDVAQRVFSGSGSGPDSDLAAVMGMVRQAAARGCGRLQWSYSPAEGGPVFPFTDPNVLWQTATWTDGCVTSASGVYADSSASTPAQYQTQSLVSPFVGVSFPGLSQFTYSLEPGLKRLRALGIRYFLSYNLDSAEAKSVGALLTSVATSGSWTLWEIADFSIVSDLDASPVVVTPAVSDADWSPLMSSYAKTAVYDTVTLAQQGPSAWPVTDLSAPPATVRIEPAGVRDVTVDDQSISFSVATPGRPVLIRASAFPGWSVAGADAIYRAGPNQMIVVPNGDRVTLSRSRTLLDLAAIVLPVVGVGLLALLGLQQRKRRRVDDNTAMQA